MSTTRTAAPLAAANRLPTVKLALDLTLLGAFVAANLPRGTGVALHEWLCVAFIVPLGVHLVLDWPWIVSVTGRLLKRLPHEVRFNHLVDLVSYVVMVAVMFSGLAESRVVLPALGLSASADRFWTGLHRVTTDALMVVLGVHLAMHARWLLDGLRRALGRGGSARDRAARGGAA